MSHKIIIEVNNLTIPAHLEKYLTLEDALHLLLTEYIGGSYNSYILYVNEVICRVREILKAAIAKAESK